MSSPEALERARARARDYQWARRERMKVDPAYAALARARKAADAEQHRAKKRALVAEAKAQGCVDCRRTDLPAEILDLDHVRGPVLFRLSDASAHSIPKVVAEIEKCEPRCPTCHALRHYRERVGEHGRFGPRSLPERV